MIFLWSLSVITRLSEVIPEMLFGVSLVMRSYFVLAQN